MLWPRRVLLFCVWFYLEMIKNNKKPAREEGLMVGADDTDAHAALLNTQMFSPSSWMEECASKCR